MSRYSLPLLILNLGGEMFYVLDQRLKAQKVPLDRAQKVLNDIASVMLHEKFLNEIFKPQPLYSKQELYVLFKEIAHASIMKLNDLSMGKLYDLMIMIFKYQMYFISRPRDILLVTLNHMDTLRNFVSSSFVYKQLDSVYFLLTKVYYPMRDAELQMIRYNILNYLQDIHVKVSIFLRLGQQNNDGTFVNPVNESVPLGIEIPGIIKVFTPDQSVKDIRAFPPGGAYTTVDIECSFDFKGNRGILLGLSIYHEHAAQNFPLPSSEKKEESQNVKSLEELVYRSEINTLMNQLIGSKLSENEDETIFIDLFRNSDNDGNTIKNSSQKKPVTLVDSIVHQNTVLKNAADDVNVNVFERNEEDLLYLLENTE